MSGKPKQAKWREKAKMTRIVVRHTVEKTEIK